MQELSESFKTVILVIGFINQADSMIFQDLFGISQECWTQSLGKSKNI